MTADHFSVLIQVLLERQPFRVFTVELLGGTRFEIDHPGAVTVIQDMAAFISPGGFRIWFDHDSVNRILETPAQDIGSW